MLPDQGFYNENLVVMILWDSWLGGFNFINQLEDGEADLHI